MTRRSERVMPGPALARDLVAGRDVDDVDRDVGELRREGGREIVAAGFDQDHVERREAAVEIGDGGEIDRSVLADRGMRAAAGLDAEDAIGRKRAGARQELGVLLGVDVVGDRGDVVAVAQLLAERVHQRRLAGADGAADADAQGAVGGAGHERNSLVYWVSCFMLAMSARKTAPPSASSGRSRVASTTASITGPRPAMMRWPSVWPSGTARRPAETILAAKACR